MTVKELQDELELSKPDDIVELYIFDSLRGRLAKGTAYEVTHEEGFIRIEARRG